MRVQILLVAIFCIIVQAQPSDRYEALGVLQPDIGSLGPHEKSVAATIELLPEIAQVFEDVASEQSYDPSDAGSIMRLSTLVFLPISKKVLLKTAEAEGRKVNVEDIYSLNAAEAVMPSVVSFMERLQAAEFFKRRINPYRSAPAPAYGHPVKAQPTYVPPVHNTYQPVVKSTYRPATY
ncbi:uncharacterized protein [Macrobrachium rosenbergii]|uniref:uncharacterized protein n=1 Tax=Macrobrachium rosenbergii TaxID=79674 RepID=UPI0034D5308B